MFCKNCGQQIKIGSRFCNNCGQEVRIGRFLIIKSRFLTWINEHKRGLIIAGVIIIAILVIASSDNSSLLNNSTQQNINLNPASSVVNIGCDDGSGGSGTIFTSDGDILTNNHVIKNATYCLVTLPDPVTGHPDKIYHAKPLVAPGLSSKYDLAFLKIDSSYTDSNSKTWGDYPTSFPNLTSPSSCDTSTPSQLGDSVRIYGYPVTSGGYNLTITDGIISSFADDGTILTSAKVDSGNSGGIVIDQNGCFIGIPSAVESGNYQNLGVIIPPSIISEFYKQLPSSLEAPTPQTSDQKCQDKYGSYSEWSGKTDSNGQPTCQCQSGYAWDGTGNACASQTLLDNSCENSYGSGSYSYTNTEKLKAMCGCTTGYTWNSDQSACIVDKNATCSAKYSNSYWDGTYCSCPTGYIWNSDQSACITLDENCIQNWPNSVSTGIDPSDGKNTCDCQAGHVWNYNRTACIFNSGY